MFFAPFVPNWGCTEDESLWTMTYSGDAQWILSEEEFTSLAPFKKTTDIDEAKNRYKATGLVQAIGMRLKLESFTNFPYTETAMAIVFLTAKVEEHPRKLKDVIHAWRETSATPSSNNGHDGDLLAERLVTLEKIILKTCCFDLVITHPYKYVFRLVKELPECPDELVQSAWIVVNDSYRTSLCIRFEPKTIAAAAIVYAAKKRVEIPHLQALTANEQGLVLDCPAEAIEKITLTLDSLYNKEYSS